MRRTTSSARRYAEAAFDIARRDRTVDAWLEQLERAARAVADPDTVRSLENPAVPFERRSEALLASLGVDLLPQARNLLLLLLRRRRIEMVGRVAREFRRLYNRAAGITEATAISAARLEEDEVRTLRERLEQLAGGRVDLQFSVDPGLLGGVQIRLGDRLIDGSVRGRLERLRSQLAASH